MLVDGADIHDRSMYISTASASINGVTLTQAEKNALQWRELLRRQRDFMYGQLDVEDDPVHGDDRPWYERNARQAAFLDAELPVGRRATFSGAPAAVVKSADDVKAKVNFRKDRRRRSGQRQMSANALAVESKADVVPVTTSTVDSDYHSASSDVNNDNDDDEARSDDTFFSAADDDVSVRQHLCWCGPAAQPHLLIGCECALGPVRLNAVARLDVGAGVASANGAGDGYARRRHSAVVRLVGVRRHQQC